jgi:hypothetical protein
MAMFHVRGEVLEMWKFKISTGFVLATCASFLAVWTPAPPVWADPSRANEVADPIAYCARVGTMDVPPGGGSPIPAVLEARARTAVGLTADAPFEPGAFYWRCMRGAVYVCTTGANIPCAAKADRARRNVAAQRFCREHRDLPVVPAYVTGHDTLYGWSCVAGEAVRGAAIAALDARGYRQDIWHRVESAAK